MTRPLPQHWLRKQPHPHWCPICKRPVTRWHEHHGPRVFWKPSDGLNIRHKSEENNRVQ